MFGQHQVISMGAVRAQEAPRRTIGGQMVNYAKGG
jgi:hypothetical protein